MHSRPHRIPLNPESGLLCLSSMSYESIPYPHHHDSCELTLISDGCHEVITPAGRITLSRGDLMLLRSNEPHERRMSEAGRYFTLAFPADEMNRAAQYYADDLLNTRLRAKAPPFSHLSASETELMIDSIERLNLFIAVNPRRAVFELRALLSNACMHFTCQSPDASENTPWLSRLLREMNTPENIRRGLPAMLRMIPYTHEYLCREFRRLIGCTPTEYINKLRLDRAHLLIETTHMTVSDICLEVGFDSASYFHKLFRKKYGLPPAKYRKARFIASPSAPVEQLPGE